MDYSININHEASLVEVVCEGHITLDLYKSIAEEIAPPSNKHRYNVVVDLKKTSIYFTTHQLYNAPTNLDGWELGTHIAAAKVALIVPSKFYRSWKFIEIVNYGIGRNLKVFCNEEEAEDWVMTNKFWA